MDLIDMLSQITARTSKQLHLIATEEATKNALILPFINALGYNVFDPTEVVPEFTADVGTKKGEKVDFAIYIDGKPMILIECKVVGSPLALKHASQLFRYFATTEARFAVLTNGMQYQFYTDIEAPNKMDERPFFEFSMLDLDEKVANEVKKFSKANFNLDGILSNASELKYTKQIQKIIAEELEDPSEEFVRMFTLKVYDGKFLASVKEQFTPIVRNAFRGYIRDTINDRIKSALESGRAAETISEIETPVVVVDDGIETTSDEIEGYHIIRAMLGKHIDPVRVVMRDTKSYCGILLDDNNRRPICRLRFNTVQKYIGLMNGDRSEERLPIFKLTDLYQYEARILETVMGYEPRPNKAAV